MTEHDLDWLLGPIAVDRFFERYFERDILHLSGRGERFYDPVFSLPDLDRIIHQSPEFLASHARYARADEAVRRNHLSAHANIPTPITPKSLSGALVAAHGAGYSLIFDEIISTWWPLARLAREIEAVIFGQVTATMFFSPPNSHGVPAHFDGFDVFILQISGSKDWQIYLPATLLPIGTQPLGDTDLGEPNARLTLEPGDLLYMPRGFIHEAWSRDTSSLHLTVGLHAYRWYELLADLVEELAENDISLRRSVSPALCRAIGAGGSAELVTEQAAALLRHCLENAAATSPILRHARNFVGSLTPVELDRFTSPELPETLDENRPIAKKPGMICYVYDENDKTVIGFPGGSIRGPAAIRPVAEWIAATQSPFRLNDLPGEISLQSKRVLVLRLLRDGLLFLPKLQTE